jgi:hypothetical protein
LFLVPAGLQRLVEPWASLYGNSKAVATVVVFVHLAGLLLGGGLAVGNDRNTLRALRAGGREREHQLAELMTIHRVVLTGLALSLASGVLLLAADLDTYLASPVFWIKMGLVALLLANGYLMTRAEGALRKVSGEERDVAPAWMRLRTTAITSLVLWFAITLAGVALVNAA